MAHGAPQSQYHASFRAGLHSLADRIKPELVLVSAGFDAHAEDPVGDLGLEVEDFEMITREIVAAAITIAVLIANKASGCMGLVAGGG